MDIEVRSVSLTGNLFTLLAQVTGRPTGPLVGWAWIVGEGNRYPFDLSGPEAQPVSIDIATGQPNPEGELRFSVQVVQGTPRQTLSIVGGRDIHVSIGPTGIVLNSCR